MLRPCYPCSPEHNKAKLQEHLAKLAAFKVQLSTLEENWLGWQEELEAVNRAIEQEFALPAAEEKGKPS